MFKYLTILTLLSVSTFAAWSQSSAGWPKEIESSQGNIILYQPQPQKLTGQQLTGVAAFSIAPAAKKEPLFGALFFDATLDIDRDARTYLMKSLKIPNIKFSAADSTIDLEKIKSSIIADATTWRLSGSLDALIATTEEASNSGKKDDFKNTPPKIIYTTKPTTLIVIDGQPILQAIEKSGFKRVVNTPYLIFQDQSTYYLYGGEIWYTSSQINSGWKTTKTVPKDLQKIVDANKDKTEKASTAKPAEKSAVPPDVIVSTEPAELISTEGAPQFSPIKETNLLAVKNSKDNIFKDITSQNYYVLKSGRWFANKSLEGNWEFVPAEEIPKDFSKLEPGSDYDQVLSSVPGTQEAKDAILDASIPQTATVDRKTAGKELKVEYDGTPQFEKVDNTDLLYAKNSPQTVIKSGAKFYVVENGVWFEGSSATGPWEVATSRPADVDKIPASSPVYNTKYVYIYDYTPEVVYVGYTPSYLGCYIYGPTVVYGTGWMYSPWYGSMYYPRPYTWGFNMGYNPWTGWSIGFGFSTGPFHFGFSTGGFYGSFGYGGWFGPPIYRPPFYPPYHRPLYGYNRPGYGRPGYGNRPNIGNGNQNIGGGNQINIGGDVNINMGNHTNNLYADKKNKIQGVNSGIKGNELSKIDVSRPGANNDRRPGTRPGSNAGGNDRFNGGRDNNVFADRDGNVFQKDKTGNWQQNNNNKWDKAPQRPDVTDKLNQQQVNRDRGNARQNTYNQANRQTSRPSPSYQPSNRSNVGGRPGGGAGGRGRR